MLGRGDRAPDYTLTDTNGERFSLDGKLTLAIFFKTSCPTCQYAWPFYERLHMAYKEKGLEVRGVSQHDRERTVQFALAFGATFPHLIDDSLKVSKVYDPEFVPTAFLIGDGKVILETLVSWNRAELDRVSRIIAEKLHATPVDLITSGEQVIPFKPG